MDKFILISCVEREINEPNFFPSLSKAKEQMLKEFKKTLGFEENHIFTQDELEELECDNAGFNEDSAWCEDSNHDNCDWKIFKI